MKDIFTKDEIKEINEFLKSLGSYLPYDKLDTVWGWWKTINPTSKEPKPCSCQSAGKLWVRYINDIKEWNKNYESATIKPAGEVGKRKRAQKKTK